MLPFNISTSLKVRDKIAVARTKNIYPSVPIYSHISLLQFLHDFTSSQQLVFLPNLDFPVVASGTSWFLVFSSSSPGFFSYYSFIRASERTFLFLRLRLLLLLLEYQLKLSFRPTFFFTVASIYPRAFNFADNKLHFPFPSPQKRVREDKIKREKNERRRTTNLSSFPIGCRVFLYDI